MRKAALPVLITVLVAVGLLVITTATERRLPFVLVGPVRVGFGIPGLLDKTTTRSQAIHRLGKPLRPRQPATQDDSDGRPDYFGGVYADVYWMTGEKCGNLNFDFDGFSGQYNSNLRVLIQDASVETVVSRRTNRSFARSVLARRFELIGRKVLFKGSSMYVMEGQTPVCVMDFSQEDGHLQELFVACDNKL